MLLSDLIVGISKLSIPESELFHWKTSEETTEEILSKINHIELDKWITKNIPDRICPHCGKRLYVDAEIFNTLGPLCGSAGYYLYCSECHEKVGTLVKIRS